MPAIHVRLEVPERELLDASEEIQRLLLRDGELLPAFRDLLLALDDAITDAFVGARLRAGAPR